MDIYMAYGYLLDFFNKFILVVPITVLFRGKDSVDYFTNIFMIVYANSLLKLFYGEPRPYLIDDTISSYVFIIHLKE
jgi:hypothetical protein